MSAELLRQKELESTHRPQLLAPEAALRAPDSADELQRRGALLVLKHSAAPLLALPPQGPPGPGPPTPPRDPARRAPRKAGSGSADPRPRAVGGLFADGDDATAPEDVSKWTVDDVCSFVGGLSGCGEYARVFKEQGIDGETLPLLTEEHLLTTMGLKLGPALKIRAQVARRLGRVFYMASFPMALPLQPPTLRGPEPELATGEQPLSPAATSPYGGTQPSASRDSPRQENGSGALLPGAPDPSQPLC